MRLSLSKTLSVGSLRRSSDVADEGSGLRVVVWCLLEPFLEWGRYSGPRRAMSDERGIRVGLGS